MIANSAPPFIFMMYNYFSNRIIKNPKKNMAVEVVVSFSSWASLSNSSVTRYNNAAVPNDVINTIIDFEVFKNVRPKADPENANTANPIFVNIIDIKLFPAFCKLVSTDKTKNNNSNDKAMLIINPFSTLIAKLIPTSSPSIKMSIATAINNDTIDLLL